MIQIALQFEGDERRIAVRREATLREVQKQICSVYRQPFPKNKCVLVVDGVRYEDFIEKPFEDVPELALCTVQFHVTDDPYFYDFMDRKGSKLTLGEELQIEDAVARRRASSEFGRAPVRPAEELRTRRRSSDAPGFSQTWPIPDADWESGATEPSSC